MITGILLLATSAWAWALPWLAPLLAKAGILVASARSVLPRTWGTAVLGFAVAALLCGILVWRVEAWLNPPPRTYTKAEIEAANYKAINADLRRAMDEGMTAQQRKDESIRRLAELNDQIATELENERAKSRNPDAVLVPADDPWLRDWHRRGW